MQEIKDQPPKVPKKPLFFYYIIALIVVMLLNALLFPSMLSEQVTQVSFDQFLSMVDEGQVSQVAWETEEEQLVFIAKRRMGRTPITRPASGRTRGNGCWKSSTALPASSLKRPFPLRPAPCCPLSCPGCCLFSYLSSLGNCSPVGC